MSSPSNSPAGAAASAATGVVVTSPALPSTVTYGLGQNVVRRLDIYDGAFNASLPNATAAMVFGSAMRAQFAALMGVPVPYVIINQALTNCSGADANAPPVKDIFSSGDPINSNALFGLPDAARDEGYFVTVPQGPLQVYKCPAVCSCTPIWWSGLWTMRSC